MKVKINNWKKYQTRTSGIKRPYWFAFDNRFLEDPKMWSLTDAEKIAWIYVLCQASLQQTSVPYINQDHANRASGVQKSVLSNALLKLEQLQIVAVTWTEPVRDMDGTRQDNTRQDKTNNNAQSEFVRELDSIYFLYPRKIGKTRGMATIKKQVKTVEELKDFRLAVTNYKDHCQLKGTEPQFIKHFSTFVNEWRDWLDWKDEAQEIISTWIPPEERNVTK